MKNWMKFLSLIFYRSVGTTRIDWLDFTTISGRADQSTIKTTFLAIVTLIQIIFHTIPNISKNIFFNKRFSIVGWCTYRTHTRRLVGKVNRREANESKVSFRRDACTVAFSFLTNEQFSTSRLYFVRSQAILREAEAASDRVNEKIRQNEKGIPTSYNTFQRVAHNLAEVATAAATDHTNDHRMPSVPVHPRTHTRGCVCLLCVWFPPFHPSTVGTLEHKRTTL